MLRPQDVSTRSMRPSPSRSPAVTPFHQLRYGERPHDRVLSVKPPRLLMKRRGGPQSVATTRSGSPSPSMSVKVTPDTSPTRENGADAAESYTRLPSCWRLKSRDVGGSG